MIRVIYSELDGPEGLTLRLEASGHAGYAPAGQDIVCTFSQTFEKMPTSQSWHPVLQ